MDIVLLTSRCFQVCVILRTSCDGAQIQIKKQSRNWLWICICSSHLYVLSIILYLAQCHKSCFILEHQWPSASLRCGPVCNSTQPRSSLKNTCQKRPSAWFCDESGLLVGYLSISLLIFSVWRVSLTVFSVSVLQLSFLDMSGSHRKNSWRRVLTVSGHSIMTMWLPSSMTFRNANRRI